MVYSPLHVVLNQTRHRGVNKTVFWCEFSINRACFRIGMLIIHHNKAWLLSNSSGDDSQSTRPPGTSRASTDVRSQMGGVPALAEGAGRREGRVAGGRGRFAPGARVVTHQCTVELEGSPL